MTKRLILIVLLMLLAICAIAQRIPYPVDSPEYQNYKKSLIPSSRDLPNSQKLAPDLNISYSKQSRTGLLVPRDASFTMILDGSDDGYSSAIDLPFSFDFYGSTQTQFFINNNGNISFGNPFSTYTSTGFPIDEFPMLAAFWADIDTRPASSGKVYYRIDEHSAIVTWDGVGYFSNHTDKLNTFQVIFSDGTDPLIGLGNNVAFSYGDMQWTTGDASGGTNGFGGTPATVGLNKGDGISFALIGRFDRAGTAYDGPGLSNDGISFLDNQLFTFNTLMGNNIPPIFVGLPTSATTLQVGESSIINFSIFSPIPENTVYAELEHDIGSGFSYIVTPGNPCFVQIEINASNANIGSHNIAITASDNGSPSLQSTANIAVNVIMLSEYILAVNDATQSISMIDAVTNEVYGPFLEGELGSSSLLDIVIAPNNQFALVSSFESFTVYHLDISNPLSPSVLGSYALSFPAEDISLSYDGRYAIVADGGSVTMLAVLDLQARTTVQMINISPHNAQGVQLGIDGKVLVNDDTNNAVHQYQLNLGSGFLSYTGVSISVPSPLNVAIHPDGKSAIVCSSVNGGSKVLTLNPDNGITILQNLNIAGAQSAHYSPDGSKALIGISGSQPDMLKAYNVDSSGTITLTQDYMLSTNAIGGYYGVDVITINSDKSKAYIGNMSDDYYPALTMIALDSGVQTQIITGSPTGLALGNLPLRSYFSYQSTNLLLSTQVQFTQFSTGMPQSYLWNFGDGNSSTDPNPIHEYYSAGTYSVSLRIQRGSVTHTSYQTISITTNSLVHLGIQGSPYFFANSINIMPMQTLLIDAGVELNFAAGTGLTVNGTIQATDVTFSGNSATGWNGIVISAPGMTHIFNGINILNAINALTLIDTGFIITNLSISCEPSLPSEVGITLQGVCNATFNGLGITNYPSALRIINNDARVSSTPTLTNIRIRNSSSSSRVDSYGLEITGAVALTIDDALIENYDLGIAYDSRGSIFERTTPTLTNIRIRNSSSSSRSELTGILLTDMNLISLNQIEVESDSTSFSHGIKIISSDDFRVSSTPTLTNIRIRNSSSSSRNASTGIEVSGSVAMILSDAELENCDTGISYDAEGTAFERTTPTLTNIRIRNSSSSSRTEVLGILLSDIGIVNLNDVIVESDTTSYTAGIKIIANEENRVSSTPTLTNIRIRNSSSSSRTESAGLNIQGNVSLQGEDIEIDNYGYGIHYTGTVERDRSTPTLTNIRIRNSSSSSRADKYGIYINGDITADMSDLEIEDTHTGIEYIYSGADQLRTTPTLTNIRIRNSSSSSRSESYGVKLMGAMAVAIDDMEIQSFTNGIQYISPERTTLRTTPTLTNIRIRNSSSSSRNNPIGIELENLSSIDITSCQIYTLDEDPSVAVVPGDGISFNNVSGATLFQNTIWGYETGLNAMGTNSIEIDNIIVWAEEQLQNPIVGAGVIIENSVISYTEGTFPGDGNINQDPLFVKPRAGDFFLKFRSPIKNTAIGALPFNFNDQKKTYSHTMYPNWNLIGIPYLTSESGYNTPLPVFADFIDPFFIHPSYTSIVQMNQNIKNPAHQYGVYNSNYTGAYNVPTQLHPPIGYWVKNNNTLTEIVVQGMMDDGDYEMNLPNVGWYLLANPYATVNPQENDFDGIAFGSAYGITLDLPGVPAGSYEPYGFVYRYNPLTNQTSYSVISPDEQDPQNTIFKPWEAFFFRAPVPNTKLTFSWPQLGRSNISAPQQLPVITRSNDLSSENTNDHSEPVEWNLVLSAKYADFREDIAVGARSNALDTYDPYDLQKLPSAPFVMNRPIVLGIDNSSWENEAGLYARDTKALAGDSWQWNILLDASQLLNEQVYDGVITVSLSEKSNIPSGYQFALINTLDGISIDPSGSELQIDLRTLYNNGNIPIPDAAQRSRSALGSRSSATDHNINPELFMIPLLLVVQAPTPSEPALISQSPIIHSGNYPNPFNPETRISYSTGKDAKVSLEIYNIKGQKVKTLVNAWQTSGSHNVVWNGTDESGAKVSSGIYLYRLSVDKASFTKKILMTK